MSQMSRLMWEILYIMSTICILITVGKDYFYL